MPMACEIQEEDVFENFFPASFRNTRAIAFVHGFTPRFGKTSDIVLWATGSEKQSKDYFRGLLASSIAVFSVFLVWVCLLLLFKRQGPQKVGWLSGRRVPLPPKPIISNDNKREIEEDIGTSLDDPQSHQEGPVENHAARHEMQIEEADQGALKTQVDQEEQKGSQCKEMDSLENLNLLKWNQQHKYICRQEKIMKALMSLACLSIIIASVLMSINGYVRNI
jgi:hypothetical protein